MSPAEGLHDAVPVLPHVMLLDLDDTIIEFSSSAASCWQCVCHEFAPACGISPERLLETLDAYRAWFWSDPERHRVGRLDMAAARRHVVGETLRLLGIDRPAIIPAMADAFAEARRAALRLFPEALGVLKQLGDRGITLALITNGESGEQRAKIERFGLAPYFHHIQVEGEFGAGKPEARAYEHALRTVRVSPAEAWMVGDNLEWDVRGAQQVGILGIWRDVAGAGLPSPSPAQPDRIIRSLTDLLPA
jgi:putative hydrolase of the HAD superfamily